jgi:hypothetical protein
MTQDKFEALINGQKIPRERLAEMFDFSCCWFFTRRIIE